MTDGSGRDTQTQRYGLSKAVGIRSDGTAGEIFACKRAAGIPLEMSSEEKLHISF